MKINKNKKIKIIFVCTQNVFRSFSAQVLSQKFIIENNITNLEIDSCGTHAYSFEEPYIQTIYKLEELGIDSKVLLNHKNKKVSKDLLNFDYIICMTKDHQSFISQKFGVDSYLFNDIAYGRKTDLEDDVETNQIGNSHTLSSFVTSTIDYINDSIPYIIKNILKNYK